MDSDDNRSSPRIRKLQNNTWIVKTRAGDVLVNCPPETLKFLLASGLPVPKIILLPPDIPIGQQLGSSGFVHQGINYASIEFLLYANYFVNGGQRTRLISVTPNQSQRLHQILQETVIGPADSTEYYPHPWVQRECRLLSYHPPLDRPIEVDDLAEIIDLETGGGELGKGVSISLDGDQFRFFEDGVEIASVSTTIDASTMPLTLAPPQPVLRQEITLQFIGGSDGFDPEGITTCFLAYFGSTGEDSVILFDAAAYLQVRLGNLGISPSQISEVVISHLHEDHIAGLPELLLGGHRVRLITSKIIYRSLLRVLSAMLDVPENEVAALFDYFPLQPGQPLLLEGKKFEAMYAIHTIPTLAVRVNGLCYSGDMRYDEEWFAQLEADGILSQTRRLEIIQFAEGARIFVQDAGGGSVHTTLTPEVLSSLAAKSKHVILTHAPKSHHHLPATLEDWQNVEFAISGHVAAVGEILHQNYEIEKLETISACPLYARLSISGRATLAQQVKLETYAPGESILQEGEISDGRAYIVHKGLVKAWMDEKLVQVLGRGNSIGERGALTLEPRVASIMASDQTQMLVLDPDVFQPVANRLGLSTVYKRVEWLWQHPIFKHLPWATLLDLALDFQPLHLPTGSLLFDYGTPGNECYLLISGAITLLTKDFETVGTFDTTGEFFGGRAVLFGTPRNTYACVSQETEIWSLPAPALQRLHLLYPSVILHLRAVESKRHGHAPFISALETDPAND